MIGIVLGAAYLLWMLQRVIFGTYNNKLGDLKRITWIEFVTLAPLVILIVLVGVYPTPLINMINNSVALILGM